MPAFTTIGSANRYLQSGIIFDPNISKPTTGKLSKLFVRKIVKVYFNQSGILQSRKLENGVIYAMSAKDWFNVMKKC